MEVKDERVSLICTAGIIAAIVIGIVVFLVISAIGTKKAYDLLQKQRGNMGAVNSNPLFKEQSSEKESPLYNEAKA